MVCIWDRFQENGLRVNLQVAKENPGCGISIFYTLSHQLETIGIRRTTGQIKLDKVRYLREQPNLQGRDVEYTWYVVSGTQAHHSLFK